MRIPDGDLVPARRRPYRGGYGSRRFRRRSLRRIALVLVLLLAAAAAAWFVRRDDTPTPRASACSASIGAGCVAMRGEVIT
jgi:hypothetical protein